MTLVLACYFKEGVVMVSDSRASLDYGFKRSPDDRLQKIVDIGPNKALGYAGSVKAAKLVIDELRRLTKKKKKLRLIENVAARIPGLAKNIYLNKCSKTDRDGGLQLILSGKSLGGGIKTWTFRAPNFNSVKLEDGFSIIGSGEVVKGYLDKELVNIQKLTSLKDQANALLSGVSSEIAKMEKEIDDTVGGMLQIILISSVGIQPLNYGFVDLNPEGPSDAKYMSMEKGSWTQYDYLNDATYPILEPGKLLSLPFKESRVHDFKVPSGILSKPKWYLNYFLTCFGTKIEPGNIEFHRVISEAGVLSFPYVFELLLSIGFWGTAKKDNLEIYLETEEGKEKIGEASVERKYLPEDTDLTIKLGLTIKKSGMVFIEAYFGGQRLGRRAIYFNKVDEKLPLEKIKLQLREGLTKSQDSEVEKNIYELIYFSLCEGSSQSPEKLTFDHEIMAIYWKTYPLNFKAFITSAYRLKPGKHKIRLEAENAATREKILITQAEIESKSSCITYPLIGDVLIPLSKPGFYYLNQYVDDILSHTSLLAAETEKPQFSYTPPDEDIKKVDQGELLFLVKRSMQSAPTEAAL